MKVKIVNKASYSREIQYFRQYRFEVLKPRQSLELVVEDPVEIAYWQSLSHKGFDIIVSVDEPAPTEDEVKVEETVKEETETDPYSQYSDADLKRIVTNFGISTRITKRWKLINLIEENNIEMSKYV